MNKRGGIDSTRMTVVLLAVVMVSIAGFMAYKMYGTETPAAAIAGQALTEGGVVAQAAQVSCPSDSTTDGRGRYEDSLAATNTYLVPTCYFMPKTAGQERVTAGTMQSDGTYSTAVDLPCTSSGTKWRFVCVTSADAAMSVDEGTDFTAAGPFVKRDVVGKNISTLQVKVEDKFSGVGKFFNVTMSGLNAGAGSTGWQTFNSTKFAVDNEKGGATTGTSLTLGTDGYIDTNIFLKTAATKRQFGEDGLRTWMLVDADGSEYSEPIVARDGGATLVSNMAAMEAEDKRKYTGYEYAYEIGSIGDRDTVINFYMESAGGVNPSANPIIEFCAEGRYNSVKQKDVILTGCWTDAATQTAVFTSDRPYFEFDVS